MTEANGGASQQRRDRERRLFAELADARSIGDDVAVARIREELIVTHLGLVRHVARRIHGGASPDDLMQAGTIGLIEAVDRFDPDRGTEFATFAVRWIQGPIRELIRAQSWPVAVPRRLKDLHAAVHGELARCQAVGQHPTAEQLAQTLGVDAGDVIEVLALDDMRRTTSLDGTADDRSSSLAETIGSPDAAFTEVDLREDLARAVRQLPRDERDAFIGCVLEGRTQETVARELGTTQSRVSRLIDRARVRLRAALSGEADQ